MKKLICALLAAFFLFGAACAEDLIHVQDLAGIFTGAEIDALETRMDEIYADTGMDMVIVTTNDSQGKEARLFAADFYDEFRDYDAYPDGVIFAFCFDLGKYYEASRGAAEELLADRGADDLAEVVGDYLREKDYYGAMVEWVDYVERVVTPRTPVQVANGLLIWFVLLGVIVGLVVTGSMKAKLKTAGFKSGAGDYLREDSLQLDAASDLFLYETVTRRKIEKEKSSSSESFTSSSGNSYSGRGGDL